MQNLGGQRKSIMVFFEVAYFNWESLTLAKVENSKVSCKEFCTNTLLSSEVKYRKWEQIVSCQLSAKLLSF